MREAALATTPGSRGTNRRRRRTTTSKKRSAEDRGARNPPTIRRPLGRSAYVVRKAYVGGGFEEEPLEVVVFCPVCAVREVGDG
jgi:hypothetical protein